MDKNTLDFLAIGDVVTDAFIQLEDAWIETDNPQNAQELCMRFGDKIPFSRVDVLKAVGNSPNAAVSAKRLGLRSAVITDIGDDINGNDILEQMKKEGISTDFVRTHAGQESNYHYVLRFKADRTILVKHTEFEYSLKDISITPQWMYLSSLAENSLPYHEEILSYLTAHPEIQLAFQPGTFQMKLGKEKLAGLYKRANSFFCNVEESRLILGNQDGEIKELLQQMHDLGPKMVLITDGPKGAYGYDGTTMYYMPIYPDPAEPKERTGAGDSFASTFTTALALGKDFEEALMWAPINPMNVVQHVGAQEGLLSREQLEELLKNKPENYKPEKI